MEYEIGGLSEGIGCTACANYFARKQTKWQSAGAQTEDDSSALPYTVSVVSDICGNNWSARTTKQKWRAMFSDR